MTNSHNRTSAVATASSSRNPVDRYAHGTNLNTSSNNHQNHNNHQNNNQTNQSINHHSNSITTLFGNSDGSNNNNFSNKKCNNNLIGGGGGYFSNRKLNYHRNNPGGWQRTPSSNASRCAGGNNLLPSSTNRIESRSNGSGSCTKYGKTAGNHYHNHHHSSSFGRTNGIQILMGGIGKGHGLSPPTLLPTSLTHFASSKCFDAPAPTALPKPPQHWTTTSSQNGSANNCNRSFLGRDTNRRDKSSAKRSLIDEFDTHNLKVLLNVQS